jgi:hypothetical protein
MKAHVALDPPSGGSVGTDDNIDRARIDPVGGRGT